MPCPADSSRGRLYFSDGFASSRSNFQPDGRGFTEHPPRVSEMYFPRKYVLIQDLSGGGTVPGLGSMGQELVQADQLFVEHRGLPAGAASPRGLADQLQADRPAVLVEAAGHGDGRAGRHGDRRVHRRNRAM